jgi:DNA-binding NarL/FixJ family response regulator
VIRVLLADDQALVRDGFRFILEQEPDITVVAEASDGAAALDDVTRTTPDVVLMDIRMPVMDGVAACARLMARPSPPHVIVLTTFDEDENVVAALRSGASGFLRKDIRARELVEAVRTVAAGGTLLGPSVTQRVIDGYLAHHEASARGAERLRSLTPREREVLELVGSGLSNAQIAAQLYLAESTVKTHLNRILSKLGLRDRASAVVVAYETGLVVPRRGASTTGHGVLHPGV